MMHFFLSTSLDEPDVFINFVSLFVFVFRLIVFMLTLGPWTALAVQLICTLSIGLATLPLYGKVSTSSY